MRITDRNTELPVNKLYPHPDNPRKDVGDVTELAESIKANGIFQNLTVVYGGKGLPQGETYGYTVIIGHRRLEAAKLAGLDCVPCVLAEMDEREQAATMLLENMQRSDLTVYEQAQGFQMMLDLGETQDGIAEKTGFSKTTIRHRLKLLELDPEEFRKSQERQATFSDYIELEKISDTELKNEALKTIGTSNFKWKVEQAISREKAINNSKEWNNLLSNKLKKISFDERLNYKQIGGYSLSKISDQNINQEIEELIEKGAKYYRISDEGSSYAWVYIYTDITAPTVEERAAALEREEEENMRRELDSRLRELEDQARELRMTFVRNFANREHISVLTEELLVEPDLYDIDYDKVAELLGIENEDNEDEEDILESKEYRGCVKKHPESVMLAMLSTINEGAYYTSLHDYNGYYKRNERLEKWYLILSNVGYRMSHEERRLLAGTHELFKKKEEK